MPLPPLGTLVYNGVNLNNAMTRTRLTGRPRKDSAGRTIVCVDYVVEVETIITDNTDAGVPLDAARAALMAPGGQFELSGKGSPTIKVNYTQDLSKARDVDFGPWPEVISWEPVGAKLAANLKWVCRVSVPECSQASYASVWGGPFVPMEFAYTVSVRLDRNRLSSRTYAGHLVIPMTRPPTAVGSDARQLLDTADRYLEQVLPDVPDGFRRETQEHKLNEAKTRIEFSVTDSQLPAALPPGCVLCDATHDYENDPKNFSRWTGTISASYELAAGTPRAALYPYFLDLLDSRLGELINSTLDVGGVLPIRWRLSEPEICGLRTCSFSFSYATLLNTEAILTAGLWLPLPNTTHQLWKQSLVNSGDYTPRGTANLTHQPSQDVIIDLCLDSPSAQPTNLAPEPPGAYTVPLEMNFPAPLPDASWVDYQCAVRVDAASNTVAVVAAQADPPEGDSARLPGVPPPADYAPSGFSLGDIGDGTGGDDSPQGIVPPQNHEKAGQQGGGPYVPPPDQPVSGIGYQRRANPLTHVSLVGHALRAGYPVPPPKLRSFAGQAVVDANRPDREHFVSVVVAFYGGIPVWYAAWDLRWQVVGVPAEGFESVGNPTW